MSQIYGQIKNPDGTTTFKPIRATLMEDGSYALAVDTELVLDAASVTISNLKIGSINQTVSGSRWIRTLDDGTIVMTAIGGDPLEGYKAARSQDAGAYPHYFGLVNDDEDWVIIRESRVANVSTFEYFAGSGSFASNWTGKAGLEYDEYFNIF